MKRATLVIAAVFFVTMACDKKSDPPAATAPSASASPAAAKAATGDLSSEEDFEDEVEQEITDDNFDTKLSELEKEIP